MLASPGVAARDPFPSGGILTRPFVTHIFNLTVVIQVHTVGNSMVLDWRDAPRSAIDAGADPAASALRAESALAGGVLHAGRGLDLPPRAATITAQRGGQILPLSCP